MASTCTSIALKLQVKELHGCHGQSGKFRGHFRSCCSSAGALWVAFGGRMSVRTLGDVLKTPSWEIEQIRTTNLQECSGSDGFLNFSCKLVTLVQNRFAVNVAVLFAAISPCSPPPTMSPQTPSQGSMALTQGDLSARSLGSLCLSVWKEWCLDQMKRLEHFGHSIPGCLYQSDMFFCWI